MTRPARVFGAAILAVTLAACSGAAAPGGSPADSPGSSPANSPGGSRPTFEPLPLPSGIASAAPGTSSVEGEVPGAIIDAARADLRGRVGQAADDAEVVVARSVTWSDGSLGCPLPGQVYTQALEPGYWVVLELDGRRYDYRVGRSGTVRLCERPFPAASGGVGGSSG